MSSHREAPEISLDPAADNTDVYAFVSPDKSDTVTLIANFVPLQGPDGGPNFYAFDDAVLYEIHVSNNQTGEADVSYQFKFTTELQDDNTFLYNTGTITTPSSKRGTTSCGTRPAVDCSVLPCTLRAGPSRS